ncbi:hypothetical protein H0X06_04480 [Candidatus Dependentiae bacterium]|nr:hypothetical protein [Candidatus Dependentiae bacterium]
MNRRRGLCSLVLFFSAGLGVAVCMNVSAQEEPILASEEEYIDDQGVLKKKNIPIIKKQKKILKTGITHDGFFVTPRRDEDSNPSGSVESNERNSKVKSTIIVSDVPAANGVLKLPDTAAPKDSLMNKETETEEKKEDTKAKSTDDADSSSKDKDSEKKDTKKDDVPKKAYLIYNPGNSEFKFGVKLRIPEFFYGKNLRLLNDNNPTDQVIYFRHTADFNLEYRYRCPNAERESVYAKMTIRNKGVWGDPESIAYTTTAPIKEVDAVFGEHKHGIPRHILWLRELWIQLSINDVFNLPFCNEHTITFGAFPFELGRGIALGTAYASDPSDIGFFSEYSVDQYAFGGKISGDIIKDRLVYDIYGALLDSKANAFDQVNLRTRGQQYGHRQDQARGFGIVNYVIAGRLKWHPLMGNEKAKIRLEPYALYNRNPEQRIEFLGDAQSDLFTLGIAGDYEFGNFECGFDTAFNLGHQRVFGWDSNTIQLSNINGVVSVNNTRVKQAPLGEVPTQKSPSALKVTPNQTIINLSPQAQSENGQIIGSNDLGTLINDTNRFSDEYINKYRGFMFVYDMGYFISKPDIKVCAAFGYASGDANPNKDEEFAGDSQIDGEYEGFIGLQETYSGTLVRSAFLLSGSGKIPRPLSFPSEEVSDPFATSVSRFTNLVYTGVSGYYRPSWSTRKWSFNVNLLGYWTDFSSPFFDARTVQNSLNRFARNFLGTEANVFIEAQLIEDLRFFTIAALFFPGSHYRDIRGRPLSKAQQSFLDNVDKTGIINNRVPLLGADKSYFVNMGLEYRF